MEYARNYQDKATGFTYRFELVPDIIPESLLMEIDSKVFILQAHKDSNHQRMLEKLREWWSKTLPKSSEPKPTFKEMCKQYGWNFEEMCKEYGLNFS